MTETLYGKLVYSPSNGVELFLHDNPWGVDFLKDAPPPIEMIYGVLADGTHVTLDGCLLKNTEFSIGKTSIAPTALFCHRLLLGAHVDSIDDMEIRRYAFELSSLASWAYFESISLSMPPSGNKGCGGFDVACRSPEDIEISIPGKGVDVRIARWMNTNRSPSSFMIQNVSAMSILAQGVMSQGEAHVIAWRLQHLVSLLVGSRVSVRAIQIWLPDMDESAAVEPLKLIYQQRGKDVTPEVHPGEVMVPLQMISDDFPSILIRWIDRTEQSILATNVFFGSQYSTESPINAKFLSAAQSLESYHRSLGTGLYMDQEAYDTLIDTVYKCIPKEIQGDHRMSLKNRLRFGNEHSLRKRLAEMFSRLPDDVRQVIAVDSSKFINKIVETRNYYTHYDKLSEEKCLKGRGLLVATELLNALLSANLLLDLGIPPASLLKFLRRSRDFAHWTNEQMVF